MTSGESAAAIRSASRSATSRFVIAGQSSTVSPSTRWTVFRSPPNGHARFLRKKFAAALPEAERYLDDLAAAAIDEALRHAQEPGRLVTLVRHTRALSAG